MFLTFFVSHPSSIDDINDSNILDIPTELINNLESLTQASSTMSLKSFVKDVVKCLELITLKLGRADAAGPSCSSTINN